MRSAPGSASQRRPRGLRRVLARRGVRARLHERLAPVGEHDAEGLVDVAAAHAPRGARAGAAGVTAAGPLDAGRDLLEQAHAGGLHEVEHLLEPPGAP